MAADTLITSGLCIRSLEKYQFQFSLISFSKGAVNCSYLSVFVFCQHSGSLFFLVQFLNLFVMTEMLFCGLHILTGNKKVSLYLNRRLEARELHMPQLLFSMQRSYRDFSIIKVDQVSGLVKQARPCIHSFIFCTPIPDNALDKWPVYSRTTKKNKQLFTLTPLANLQLPIGLTWMFLTSGTHRKAPGQTRDRSCCEASARTTAPHLSKSLRHCYVVTWH